MIVAMAKERVIGKDNQMPWHLPADLAHFKKTTLNHPVIMGRKTYQSIGFALPKRKNIVISRSKDFSAENITIVSTPKEAIEAAGSADEIMIMGGATIYQEFLPFAQRLYLTLIDLDVAGDTFFPDYQHLGWNTSEQQSHLADDKNPYNYQFIILDRVTN
ncbi:MAG: type 3 dihydrofolate reductase [Gammaproteobacteria bacterium CG22_combo_CG10-13_8_21_14_all_40_8]|nr:MAG: type 3 dihydrofolate reductase [Gammaproteobacteria bacterium CG22_combo_CG10-13_8_21_14_all_40_8]